jgi:PhoH-like ATPase
MEKKVDKKSEKGTGATGIILKNNGKKYIVVMDTNIILSDLDAPNKLKENNFLVITGTTVEEVDKLKVEKNREDREEIKYMARKAIHKIEELIDSNDPNVAIIHITDWTNMELLDNKKGDPRILAVVQAIIKAKKGEKNGIEKIINLSDYDKIKFISKDTGARVLAKSLFSPEDLIVEDYKADKVEVLPEHRQLKVMDVKVKDIDCSNYQQFTFNVPARCPIEENGTVVCTCEVDIFADKKSTGGPVKFVAIRKGKKFMIVNPNISAAKIRPRSLNSEKPNWEQFAALYLLKDQSVPAVFLSGCAGTGKTLLAIAAGVEQYEKYTRIIIVPSQVPLRGKDDMGFLPGDVADKLAPWRKAANQAWAVVKKANSGNSGFSKIFTTNPLDVEPLQYLRGQTITDAFVIVEDAQNLTKHEIDTIMTRVGDNCKVVFTGDIKQIDALYLDSYSCGLSMAIDRFKGKKVDGECLVAVVIFEQVQRSPLARLVVENS